MDHGVVRASEDKNIDYAYLSALIVQTGGISAPAAAELINARRYERFKALATARGASEDEAEREGRHARVSVQSVRNDIRKLMDRARQAGLAGAVAFLDDQIQAIEDDIEETYRIAAAIWEDIERSRKVRKNKTKGPAIVLPDGTVLDEDSDAPQEVELTRETIENLPAQAALWGRLVDVTRRRQELREEQRLVRFGQMTFDREAQLSTTRQSIAQIMTKMDDPEAAKEAVLRMIAFEIESLEAAGQMPMSGDMIKLHAMKQAIAEGATKNLRDYLKLHADVGRSTTFEISYQLVQAD